MYMYRNQSNHRGAMLETMPERTHPSLDRGRRSPAGSETGCTPIGPAKGVVSGVAVGAIIWLTLLMVWFVW